MIRKLVARAILTIAITGSLATPLLAQNDVIQLGITYRAGARPGIIVLAGAGLDSVRKIVERDLDYSDRFEVAFVADSAAALGDSLNLGIWKQYGLAWAVELQRNGSGVRATLHDLAAGETKLAVDRPIDPAASANVRMAIHRLSDTIVTAITGDPGIAATRILFQFRNHIWRIDSDGANLTRVSEGTGIATSPAWSPSGDRIAYTEIRDYAGPIILQSLISGSRQTVPGTSGQGNSLTPDFSPDGREMIFARSTDQGTDLARVDLARMCCVLKLTVIGKLADNLNPTYSPDGRRVAFMSTRAGRPQIYVMDADGANQRALVPFDGISTGPSFAPAWSPNGQRIAFHRDIAGGRQVMVYDFGTGRSTAVTSVGRNEDPSWAPDSRHLVFRSSREGRVQLWVLDPESGRIRQLTNVNGRARLPAWSPRLTSPLP